MSLNEFLDFEFWSFPVTSLHAQSRFFHIDGLAQMRGLTVVRTSLTLPGNNQNDKN